MAQTTVREIERKSEVRAAVELLGCSGWCGGWRLPGPDGHAFAELVDDEISAHTREQQARWFAEQAVWTS